MSFKTNPAEDTAEILIVEDSLTQSEQLKYLLEQHGYRVTEADSGKQATALLGDHKPTLVITDIVMPEMNGYELCKWIKSDERFQDIPVILLTSLSNSEDVLEGLACGADNFITKPYSEDYLLSNIEQILANRKLRKTERVRVGVEILFGGKKRFITADQQQMLTLLISTYEAAVHRNAELVQAQNDLRSLNERLEDLGEERTAELSADIAKRKRAEEEIRKLNAELEQRVAERTAQLEMSNKELEAFAYSVSHDLRAPLRAVDGFSRIVLEEYSDKLDDEGKRLLNMVRANTQKMDKLIADLLELSRMTQAQIQSSRIDMTAMAQSVYQEVALPEVRERFEFSIAAMTDALGDPTLIRQVWRNLLSNAVKFTSPRDTRRIEVGGYTEKDRNVYFVKDSGVGFDPQYAHKLFGAFQRLHKASEFEGTGIGLAIVLRIVHRHGGEVWAEGQVNDGAAFYFELPVGKRQ